MVRAHQLDADVPECLDDVHLNNAIIAQLQGSGCYPVPDLELPGWTEEMVGQLRSSEARMVSGERALQGATLFFIENQCRVIQHSRALSDLMELMEELAKLQAMVRRQGDTISSLTDHVMRLERWRGNLRRGLGDSLGRSSGSSIYGSAWSSSETRASPIVEHVTIKSLANQNLPDLPRNS